ncbi:hypothetical protein niasHS_002895 [Heterodera schachtii]|uniref:Uncharacterized protein n=1 Tax=Heterodera schachtii TaxID=97005 RepID=A0ABD2K944_HETSC
MTKFVCVLLLLFAWTHQIVHLSAAPPSQIYSIEFNRDNSNNQQDNDLKSANGVDDNKMTNGVISQDSAQVVTTNGTAELETDPLTVSVELQRGGRAVGNQFNINFTDISYMLVCSARFRISLPSDTTLRSHSNMTPVPNTSDQFTLPDGVHLYPGLSHTAEVVLSGNGQPEVTILDTLTVLTTEKCPNDV